MGEERNIHPDEVKQHTTKKSCWVVIHNKVYDVTEFLNQHPGGEEVLRDVAGTDATEAYEDIGHSNDARDLLDKLEIGNLHPDFHVNRKVGNYSKLLKIIMIYEKY